MVRFDWFKSIFGLKVDWWKTLIEAIQLVKYFNSFKLKFLNLFVKFY